MASGNGNSRSTAVITAVGIVLGAAITNLDTIVRLTKGVQAVTVEYSGYRPTGVFETEFRYYHEVSGARADMEDLEERLVQTLRQRWIESAPESIEQVDALIEIAVQEAPQFDEIIEMVLPIYERHYTVHEIQVLNRFYSTAAMQDMVRKDRLINVELAPVVVQLQQEYINRVMPAVEDLLFGN